EHHQNEKKKKKMELCLKNISFLLYILNSLSCNYTK
ncbi:unnamed protein product, partial [Brassica rapa subsp. narinosa]